MIKRILRWMGFAVGSVAGLAIIAYGVLYILWDYRRRSGPHHCVSQALAGGPRAAAVMAFAAPLVAQEVSQQGAALTWPAYSDQQRWNRENSLAISF